MADEWYYAINNAQRGPVSEAELRDLADRGQLKPGDLVWKDGMAEWVPASSVRGLLPEPRREPDRRDAYRERDRGRRDDRDDDRDRDDYRRPRRPRGDSNRVGAGVVGILLGWLGIHKFMLGMTNAGLIMLLVSLIGGVLTCGAAAVVMSIIGLVEGIIYLTKSDDEFYELYVVQKKEWF